MKIMKISDMINELTEAMEMNGDQELVIMTDGNRYPVIEVYTDDEHELYLEGYKCEMSYVKPTKKQIEYAIKEGWSREVAERGYDIVDFDGTGMLEIEAIGDVYLGVGDDDGYDDDACAHEAERSGFCKIIPVDELPENFDRRYFGWIDTPENRKRIQKYCDKYCQ